MSEITVRRTAEVDWEDLQRLNALLFKFEDSLNLDGHSRNLDWPYSDYAINYFKEAARGEHHKQGFVALSDGRTIGYLIGDTYEKGWMAQNPIAEIDNMFVEEDFRHHGTGSKLVAAFKDWAKEIGAKRLKVAAYTDNRPATEFYKSQGFTSIETVFEQPFD